jgi:pimeloyl-ACP methyl ester carboxylesterase
MPKPNDEVAAPRQSHHLPTDLVRENGMRWGIDSEVIFATAPARQAALFVHGFGGSATGTWLEFPPLLPLESEAQGYDLYFFGYDGKRDTAAFSAAGLFELLEALFQGPAKSIINPSLPPGVRPRKSDFAYRRLLICAHSLGAVVTRKALLEAGNQVPPRRWLPNVQLLFFAPAHNGASILPLASQALSTIAIGPLRGKLVESVLKLHMPVLSDLEPGSQTLNDLRTMTESALGPKRNRNGHLRAHVVHGGRDTVVVQNTFMADHPFARLPGRRHTEVCKPRLGFLDPLELLIKHL